MQFAAVVTADVRPPNYIIAGCEVCQSLLSSGMEFHRNNRCHLKVSSTQQIAGQLMSDMLFVLLLSEME
jgi:hypothetical protein